jgi:hypothetical protein
MARDRPSVTLISHSLVIYWWPAILAAFGAALVSYLQGEPVPGAASNSYVHPSNNPGLIFIAVLMLLLIFTNAKLRGIASYLTLAVIAFFVVLFAWLGWWDAIFEFVPQLSAKANAGFYLVFGTVLLIVWLSAFLFFDRLTYWRIYPGQIVEERLIGGASNSHDTDRLAFAKMDRDLFKHGLLGLGAGDVKMITPGREPIYIPNILHVEAKIRKAQELVVISPEAIESETLVMPEKPPAGAKAT